MNNIHFIDPSNAEQNNYFLNDVYRLRNDTFKTRLGWEVSSENGLEKDGFDKLDVCHIAMTDQKDHVVGCWRALPTQGPYMLRNVFPQLLRGEYCPDQSDIWEISRFTVDKEFGANTNKLVSDSTARLVKSFYDFAKHKGIKSYVLVTTVACERILRCLGVKTRRMGDGKSMQVGIERSVALWLYVDESLNIPLIDKAA
ncbi:MAG: N-acyl-L-homoserine lactone synthetase [Colwellia sp.]|jgi:N-acyl-L-homoserine lactone synthetase